MARAHKHFGAEQVFKGETPHARSDMNVTPLIDVLLVLLVIFMATLPLAQVGIDVDLPAETKTANQQQPTDLSQIVLQYSADGRISINHKDVAIGDLESQLRTIYDARKDKTMFIMAAGTLPYHDIVQVIDAAKGAGVDKVGIVTEGMQKAAGAATGG